MNEGQVLGQVITGNIIFRYNIVIFLVNSTVDLVLFFFANALNAFAQSTYTCICRLCWIKGT